MTLKDIMRHAMRRWFGVYIARALPHGSDVFHDISTRLSDFRCRVIVDVGANEGQWAANARRTNPDAQVHSIEPIQETFTRLRTALGRDADVALYQLALGAEAGNARMVQSDNSKLSHITTGDVTGVTDDKIEHVRVETLDRFCDVHGITSIDYLKVDTEGADLDVLKGARGLLQSQAISFVEVEAGMNPENERHVAFEELKQYLEAAGYRLFGLYEQVHEWPSGAPILRRTNCVYIAGAKL